MISYYSIIDSISNDDTLDTVILPLGSIEQHSHHLPVGTDYLIVSALAKAVAERIHAYLLPALPISTCYEHKGKKGSVWVSPKTFYGMLQDIIICLKDQGFHKVIVMIGHGGIFVAHPAVRELNATVDGLQVIILDSAASPHCVEILEGDPQNEIHAGEMETSMVLYLYEQTVDIEKMRQDDCIPSVPREYLNYSSLLKISDTGAWGLPSLASKEKGERLFKQTVDDYIAYIESAFKFAAPGTWGD